MFLATFKTFFYSICITLKRKVIKMKKEAKLRLFFAVSSLTAFAVWTLLVSTIDVKAIGPNGSSVGFAALNAFVHRVTGVNMNLYSITDWLGLVPIFVCISFAVFGFIQWIKRKKIKNVDYSIFVLGGFYVIVIATYLLFENLIINYRPVLINGFLEASYPSSTTMLVLCVMPTAIMQLKGKIKNKLLLKIITAVISAFIIFMVIGRLLSGVHWFSDIIGAILLSTGLVALYDFAVELKK